MPAIHHIPVHETHVTPEAHAAIERAGLHWEPRSWDNPDGKMRVYDFLVRADTGTIKRYLTGIPVEQGVEESLYQISEAEVIVVTREQYHPQDEVIYSIRLSQGTSAHINNLFEYPV